MLSKRGCVFERRVRKDPREGEQACRQPRKDSGDSRSLRSGEPEPDAGNDDEAHSADDEQAQEHDDEEHEPAIVARTTSRSPTDPPSSNVPAARGASSSRCILAGMHRWATNPRCPGERLLEHALEDLPRGTQSSADGHKNQPHYRSDACHRHRWLGY